MPSFLAPAKINLHLRVLGRRHDGYHLLDTSFAYVDVADKLEIRPDEELTVLCSHKDLSGHDNLVYIVLDALKHAYNVSQGLHVRITKHIPLQAGLGGGSSDAATALMAANHLWGLSLSKQELIDFSLPYGADIPCFLFGRASIASGIGERLRPINATLPAENILLAYPGTGTSTAEVFRHYDMLAELTRNRLPDNIRARSGTGDGLNRLGYNDLEKAATELCPTIGNLLDIMRESGGISWMSGSGSVCVGLFATLRSATSLARDLKSKGLASWTHVGRLVNTHPMEMIDDEHSWGVAKW